MHKRLRPILAALALLSNPATAQGSVSGTWINPRGTVVVTTGDCREKLCGWVSWASEEALADATDAGVQHLIGTELLQDYHATGERRWTGRVYVPDMGRTFSSTIEQLDANRLKISGCLLGSWFCRSQIWLRH
ncbi:DUF2147 domain-containing protein [Sphingobium nicotianae]|uniref:DUF2147 domain-containing protein n=1 Tax=Sphingobium nicotianae TaxID=2782607 RepID=A0A9X1DH14_9SPHN|nr:DUF2147 domain-containing protein [Sphingobium nicotianae]MBT2189138.1 DUF2147 domain-containing protein [Sphingobium nicotianae]